MICCHNCRASYRTGEYFGQCAIGYGLPGCQLCAQRPGVGWSGRPSPNDEMQDQGDQREYQQQVDQASRHMEYSESANPRYQQHNE